MVIEQAGKRKFLGWISKECMRDIQRGCRGNPLKMRKIQQRIELLG